MLQGKRILLGIGGGIAVYRAVELMRLLIKQGAEVKCVMTQAAQAFVTPLTFEALSGQKVHHDLFDLTQDHGMGHIQLVRWADAVLIAPVTSNLLAKIAHGMADDLLTTLLLACEKPVLLAPAMNVSMWQHANTQSNIAKLTKQGYHVVEPATGELACGEQGAGRLAEPALIQSMLLPLLVPQRLQGQTWVINAGPTVEPWDAVRVLSNRATGTLGMLLANAAAIQGAQVTLIAGAGTPESHPLVARIDVLTAAEMLQQCAQSAGKSDVFVGTAAVSDYRFAKPIQAKLKRQSCPKMQADLIANPDIIAHIAAMPKRPKKVIAFAAESSQHIDHGKQKLKRKKVDAIVANDVSNMGSDQASGWWITPKQEVCLPQMSKSQFAYALIEYIEQA
ncbi:MAG: bifunctional phosphopantothenoylcysteine decarboxylase/phosphopantothenate--cysteine ligase CoaBC [Ghiorsea sp.]